MSQEQQGIDKLLIAFAVLCLLARLFAPDGPIGSFP